MTHFAKILEEDYRRLAGVLKENTRRVSAKKPKPQRVSHKCKKELAERIINHPQLTTDQKKQALRFLFEPAYSDGCAIAREYVRVANSRGSGIYPS